VAGQDGGWHRARSVLVTEDEAEHAARTYAHLTPSWANLLHPGDGPSSVPDTWAA